jgi:quaternary ammonium compound-resistance protein SugE
MPWLYLLIAGLMEVVWAAGLARSNGLREPIPTAITALALALSMGLLALALRDLPLGVAYAVWVGIGVLGTTAFGMLWLGEPVSAARVAFLGLLFVSVAGLKWTA